MSETSSSARFARASAVRRVGDEFAAELVDGWDIAGNANGGYLLATLARAMREISEKPEAVSVTAHYLSPGKSGPVTIRPTLLKSGKTFSTVTAGMYAADKILLHATGTFGDLTSRPGALERLDAGPPQLPAVEECVRVKGTADGFPPPMMNNIDLRLHPDDMGFASGTPHGRAQVRGWLRLLDDEPMDSLALLMAVDAFPPTAFNAALPVAWTPTVELTAHVRAIPRPGWLRCEFTTSFVSGGFLEEDGVVWDESGTLVAQSRQLALLPRAAAN